VEVGGRVVLVVLVVALVLDVAGGEVVVGGVVVGVGVCDGAAGLAALGLPGSFDCLSAAARLASNPPLLSAASAPWGLTSTVAAPAVAEPTTSAARTGSADRFLTRRKVTVRQRTTIG
jgi:hypothetical protein